MIRSSPLGRQHKKKITIPNLNSWMTMETVWFSSFLEILEVFGFHFWAIDLPINYTFNGSNSVHKSCYLYILWPFIQSNHFYYNPVYVDMGLAYNNPVTLTVVSSGSTSSTRSFSIKVTQIECSSVTRGILFIESGQLLLVSRCH